MNIRQVISPLAAELKRAIVVFACVAACARAQHVDRLGDPLPERAVQRLGTLRLKYPGGVDAIAYLPDGRGVVAVSKQLDIWNLAAGQLVTSQALPVGVRCLDLGPDGQRLLFVGVDGSLLEWELGKGVALRHFDCRQKRLRWGFYSDDGTRALTTGTVPPTLKEWDLASERELCSIQGDMAQFDKGIYGPGSTTAFVGGGFQTVMAHYNLKTGEKLKAFLDNYHVYDLCLSPDSERLLVGSRSYASEWQIEGYRLLNKFTGHHGGAVVSVAYGPESSQVLTGSRDGSIRLWDRHKPEVLQRWFPHESYVTQLRLSPGAERVLSYGAHLVAESCLPEGQAPLKWERHSGAVQSLTWLPDARRVVSGSADGTLRVWNARSGVSLQFLQCGGGGVWAVAVTADGRRVAAGCKDGAVREFELPHGGMLRELPGHHGYVRAVAYTADGARLLSAADDGALFVWESGPGEPKLRMLGHRGGILALALSPDGQQALSGGRDGTARLWNLSSGDAARVLTGHHGWVEAVAFLPDGQRAVSTARDGAWIVWDLASGAIVSQGRGGARLRAVAVSADGQQLFMASASQVVACDTMTGKERFRLRGHRLPVRALALASDNTLLASASEDTSVLLWSLADD